MMGNAKPAVLQGSRGTPGTRPFLKDDCARRAEQARDAHVRRTMRLGMEALDEEGCPCLDVVAPGGQSGAADLEAHESGFVIVEALLKAKVG